MRQIYIFFHSNLLSPASRALIAAPVSRSCEFLRSYDTRGIRNSARDSQKKTGSDRFLRFLPVSGSGRRDTARLRKATAPRAGEERSLRETDSRDKLRLSARRRGREATASPIPNPGCSIALRPLSNTYRRLSRLDSA